MFLSASIFFVISSIKRLLVLAFFFLCCSSFFGKDEEKQIQKLHQNAERAMQSGDFEAAKKAYEDLLGRVDVVASNKYRIDWITYVDTILRLAEAEEKLGHKERGAQRLSQLLLRQLPAELIPRVQLARARLRSPQEAFQEMKLTASFFPQEYWEKETRSLYQALEYSLNETYDALLKKAKRFMVCGLYGEAIPLYRQALEAIEKGFYPKASLAHSTIEKKVRYRLAESYYLQAQYGKAISLIFFADKPEDRIDREMLYLAAMVYKEEHEFEKALECFEKYSHSGGHTDLDHFEEALFEMGIHFFQNQNDHKAQSYFERILSESVRTGKLATLSAIYLSRIYLKDKKYQMAEELLSPLIASLSVHDPLRYEVFFLRGEIAYQRMKFQEASSYFEESLFQNYLSSAWKGRALLHWGSCFVKLAEQSETAVECLKRAEAIFLCLLQSQTSEKEEGILALCRLFLIRNEKEDVEKAKKYLSARSSFSLAFQHEALLLLTEIEEGADLKEALFEQAQQTEFQSLENYSKGWYLHGFFHFQEALKSKNNKIHLKKALFSLEKAFDLEKRNNRERAAHILKWEAKVNYYEQALYPSFLLVEKLLNEFDERESEREETLYLKGLIASQLDPSYFSTAQESLQKLCLSYPKGKYTDAAYFVLGVLYFNHHRFLEAKESFLSLIHSFPQSPYMDESLFWTAEAAEKLKENGSYWRQMVYQKYPSSPYAPEAYFRLFSEKDYRKGEEEAIKHLEKFPLLFPQSPLIMTVYYLMGKQETSFEKAQEAYEKGLALFGGEERYLLLHYQMQNALASLYLNHDVEIEKAVLLLQKIDTDIGSNPSPLYQTLWEESVYALVQCNLKLGRDTLAQELLMKLIAYYKQQGIREGYYFSLVWRDQGKLALKCQDFETALHCFEISEVTGKEYLTDEKLLTLLLLKSEVHRGKMEYDIAMRFLSKAINADVASPLRLKAMYLRAELYELQDRPELATRQLEALAKKGGEWAALANEKLRRQYGYIIE